MTWSIVVNVILLAVVIFDVWIGNQWAATFAAAAVAVCAFFNGATWQIRRDTKRMEHERRIMATEAKR